jgi:uncharacterized protein
VTDALVARLRSLPSLIVAYSGGVDSAFLAVAATRELGSRVLAVTADSPSYPAHHRQLALDTAKRFGLRHVVIETREMARPAYRANAPDRCYHRKHELVAVRADLAVAEGIAAVADGNNADDRGDYRPGRRAAREFGVISPLDEAGLTKADVRGLAREAGLPSWDEPASACLSSRIPYYSQVTEAKLAAIERAEHAMHALGFRVVRVRHYGDTAKLELGQDELARALTLDGTAAITRALAACGFRHVEIDPRGYRQGSLNEGIVLHAV